MIKNTKELLTKRFFIDYTGNCPDHIIEDFIRNIEKCPIRNLNLGTTTNFIFNIVEDRFKFLETSICDLVGYTVNEVMNISFTEILSAIIPVTDAEDFSYINNTVLENYLIKSRAENTTINIEFNIITREKIQKRLLAQYRSIYWNDSGKPILTLGRMIDVTSFSKPGNVKLTVVKDNQIIHHYSGISRYTPVFGLSKKEFEIITYFSKGLSNAEVARKMNLSLTTVYTHRRNIREKTNLTVAALLSKMNKEGYVLD